MAGYWPKSNTQLVDTNGKPMVGAKCYFYEGNTSTPLPVYTGADLSPLHTQPILTDANGLWPPVFFAEVDGAYYRERATKPNGNSLFDILNVPIIWQPPAQPPEPVIDETAVAFVGALWPAYFSATPLGWLPCNNRTMGSASSGGNFASAAYEALFLLLWPRGELTVSGGRGVSAAIDWAAGKTITLPDLRGRGPIGDDLMGGLTSAGRVNWATLGASGGTQTVQLTGDQNGPHTHAGTTDGGGSHAHSGGGQVIATGSGGAGPGNIVNLVDTGTAPDHDHTFTTGNSGTGEAHNNMQPSIAVYWFIKY